MNGRTYWLFIRKICCPTAIIRSADSDVKMKDCWSTAVQVALLAVAIAIFLGFRTIVKCSLLFELRLSMSNNAWARLKSMVVAPTI